MRDTKNKIKYKYHKYGDGRIKNEQMSITSILFQHGPNFNSIINFNRFYVKYHI